MNLLSHKPIRPNKLNRLFASDAGPFVTGDVGAGFQDMALPKANGRYHDVPSNKTTFLCCRSLQG